MEWVQAIFDMALITLTFAILVTVLVTVLGLVELVSPLRNPFEIKARRKRGAERVLVYVQLLWQGSREEVTINTLWGQAMSEHEAKKSIQSIGLDGVAIEIVQVNDSPYTPFYTYWIVLVDGKRVFEARVSDGDIEVYRFNPGTWVDVLKEAYRDAQQRKAMEELERFSKQQQAMQARFRRID